MHAVSPLPIATIAIIATTKHAHFRGLLTFSNPCHGNAAVSFFEGVACCSYRAHGVFYEYFTPTFLCLVVWFGLAPCAGHTARRSSIYGCTASRLV